MFDGYLEKWHNFVKHDKIDLVPEPGNTGNPAKQVFSNKDFRKFRMGFFEIIFG